MLVDENQMKSDEVQDLTNMLCHLYGRCSRTISIPTPVYYAHLAAFRARAHIQSGIQFQKDVTDCESINSGSGNSKPECFASSGSSSRIHYTKHRVPSIGNFDNYVEMPLKMRCSMYFC